MKILMGYNHDDACFEIEAVGDKAVEDMIEQIYYAQWEQDDPDYKRTEFEIVKQGAPLYFDTDGPSYLIIEV